MYTVYTALCHLVWVHLHVHYIIYSTASGHFIQSAMPQGRMGLSWDWQSVHQKQQQSGGGYIARLNASWTFYSVISRLRTHTHTHTATALTQDSYSLLGATEQTVHSQIYNATLPEIADIAKEKT